MSLFWQSPLSSPLPSPTPRTGTRRTPRTDTHSRIQSRWRCWLFKLDLCSPLWLIKDNLLGAKLSSTAVLNATWVIYVIYSLWVQHQRLVNSHEYIRCYKGSCGTNIISCYQEIEVSLSLSLSLKICLFDLSWAAILKMVKNVSQSPRWCPH